MRRFIRIFSIAGLALFALGTLVGKYGPSEDINGAYQIRGAYDPELNTLNDLASMEAWIDQEQKRLDVSNADTAKIVELMDGLLKKRFYHGTARYNLSDNWMAYAMGACCWDDLRMMVNPNEILGKKVVVCNQMTIVFSALLARRSITHRAVGLTNHMVTEIKYNGKWHMYDPDYEPDIVERKSTEDWLKDGVHFRSMYMHTNGRFFNDGFKKILSSDEVHYFDTNQPIAKRLKLFQLISGFLSNVGWLIFLILMAVLIFIKK